MSHLTPADLARGHNGASGPWKYPAPKRAPSAWVPACIAICAAIAVSALAVWVAG